MKFLLTSAATFAMVTATFAKQPNVLIVYADDLGYGDLGCYSSVSKIPTPHLDQLASEGMRFTDGHSSSGICTPSRYALLTGRHHWRDFNGIVGAFGKSVFDPERLTLPEMMQEKGYHTAAIGKWHLGWDWDAIRKEAGSESVVDSKTKRRAGFADFDWTKPIPDGPLAHGFDYYFGDTVINFPPYGWIENDKLVVAPTMMMDSSKWKPIKEGNWECRTGPMVEGWDPYENIPEITRRGVKYIKEQANRDKPFFLYFAYPSPHAPIIPNDAFDGASEAGPYGDLVVETDESIGQLLVALEESGQSENTIVIFSADNGPERYAYERDTKYGHWSSGSLRGLKRDLYEGGHRVPFIIKYPSVVKAGSQSGALVSQIDIMATIAQVIGYTLPEENAAEDSYSLLALIKGETESVRESHVHNTHPGKYSIRLGEWNLIDHKTGYHSKGAEGWEKRHGYDKESDGYPQLYHILNDQAQKRNLADRHAAIVTRLQDELKEIIERGHSAPRLRN